MRAHGIDVPITHAVEVGLVVMVENGSVHRHEALQFLKLGSTTTRLWGADSAVPLPGLIIRKRLPSAVTSKARPA